MGLRVQVFMVQHLKGRTKQVTPLLAFELFHCDRGLSNTRALIVYLPHCDPLAPVLARPFTAFGFYQNVCRRAAVSVWPG